MKDHDQLTLAEMFERREAIEQSVASAIGRLVFAYAKLNAALHYCVAWHNDGVDLDRYGDRAETFSAAKLLGKIEKQAESRFGSSSSQFRQYREWAKKAHAARELRNVIMHARWGIEPRGSHAIAISTPPFASPKNERVVSVQDLEIASKNCIDLSIELGALRERFPL